MNIKHFLSLVFLFIGMSDVHASFIKMNEENESGKPPKLMVEVGGEKADRVRKLLANPFLKDVILAQGSKIVVDDQNSKIKITATDAAVDLVKAYLQEKEGRRHGVGHRLGKEHGKHEHHKRHGHHGPDMDQGHHHKRHGHHKFGIRGKQHDETILPRGFSAAVYKSLNPDVAAAYGDDDNAVIAHYVKFGRDEGREYIPGGFSPKSYLLLNRDVAEEAKKHTDPFAFAVMHRYIWAPLENRPYLPRSFDPEVYLKLNQDVAAEAIKGGLGPKNFAVWHYLNHGRFEDRSFDVALPQSFTPATYYAKNADVLQNALKEGQMNDRYAVKHYKLYGYFEGRQY